MACAGRMPVSDHDSPATSGARGFTTAEATPAARVATSTGTRRPAMSRLQAKTVDLMLALDDGLDILTAKAHAGRGHLD